MAIGVTNVGRVVYKSKCPNLSSGGNLFDSCPLEEQRKDRQHTHLKG